MQNPINRVFSFFIMYKNSFERFRLTWGKGDEVGTIHMVVNTVGSHPQDVGNGVVQVGAECVDKIADADMLQLRNT